MEYRKLSRGDEPISAIGLGSGSLPNDTDKAVGILNTAIESGVNYFDLAPSVQASYFAFGKAFAGHRDKS